MSRCIPDAQASWRAVHAEADAQGVQEAAQLPERLEQIPSRYVGTGATAAGFAVSASPGFSRFTLARPGTMVSVVGLAGRPSCKVWALPANQCVSISPVTA